MYWIGCSGNGYVAMAEDRLEAMFEQMSTFKFLLMGHPNMKAKVIKKTEDSTQVLEIPVESQVFKSSFLLLVGCFFGSTQLPPRGPANSRLTELLETILTFGECEFLEQKLQHQSNNPMTPEEDTDEKYTWTFLHNPITSELESLHAKGFFFTTIRILKQYCSPTYYFRAPHGTPPVETAAAGSRDGFGLDEMMLTVQHRRDELQAQRQQQQAHLQAQLKQQQALVDAQLQQYQQALMNQNLNE